MLLSQILVNLADIVLGDYLLEFIRLCWRTESTEELLKHSLIESQTSASE